VLSLQSVRFPSSDSASLSSIEHPVLRVIVHPQYQSDFEPASFDLALLELGRSAMSQPLALPNRLTEEFDVPVESAGWGIARKRTTKDNLVRRCYWELANL
jgi:hypothetical protein